VEFLDENGTVVGEEPIVYWSYQGLARDDPASTAFLGMDDRGLYGFVDFLGTRYKFRPADEGRVLAPGEEARVLVTWRSVRQAAWEAVAPFVPDPVEGTFESTVQAHGDPSGDLSVPDPWDSAATSSGTDNRAKDADRRTFQAGIVQAYADKRYRDYTGNYATRIANALGAQESMWQKVDISIKLSSVKATPNFSDSGDCGTHLSAFKQGHTRDSTADAWQLFTGKDLNLLGCGYRNPSPGAIRERNSRDSIVESQDESNWDSYDPDETSDLGLVSGHELSHNWGEPDHPRDTRNCGGWVCYNIMADAVDPDVQEFWHTSGSKARIKQATKGQF